MIIYKVYADGTGDFTDLKAAVSATPNKDLVSLGDSVTFEIQGYLTNYYLDFNGWTTDSTYKIYIKAKPGLECTSTIGAGDAVYDGGTNYLLAPRLRHIVIDGIELTGGGNQIFQSNNTQILNCLIHNTNSRVTIDEGAYLYNCILYNCGLDNATSGLGTYTYNTTLEKCTIIADVNHGGYNGEMIIRYVTDAKPVHSTVVYNETTGGYNNYFDITANAATDYNADSEGEAPGTNNFTVSQSDFVDYANGNFNISSSSPLYTAGAGSTSIGATLGAETFANLLMYGDKEVLEARYCAVDSYADVDEISIGSDLVYQA